MAAATWKNNDVNHASLSLRSSFSMLKNASLVRGVSTTPRWVSTLTRRSRASSDATRRDRSCLAMSSTTASLIWMSTVSEAAVRVVVMLVGNFLRSLSSGIFLDSCLTFSLIALRICETCPAERISGRLISSDPVQLMTDCLTS